MKTWLFIMVVLCGIAASAAKVALIPAAPELAPVADQVLVTMSNDSGIEFLERAGIEAVLKERKLTAAGLTGSNLTDMSKTIHADLFAVITAKPAPKGKKEAVVSGFIVYDARNGFRLVNAAVSEQDAVKEIVERLQQAQDIIKNPEKQILLSIVTVRDAGVPEKYKYQMAFITAELDRQLSSIPGVVMLERDYLDSVNQERKITGQMFNLAPSARLLRLEFSPVDSSDKIMLTIRITDVTGKEQIRYKIDDAFNSPDDTVKGMIANLSGQLKLTMPIAAIATGNFRRTEAARYYEEYSFLMHHGDYDTAQRKLQAAIALCPDTPKYRMAMIPVLSEYIKRQPALNSNKDFDKVFSKAETALLICDEVSHDFPTYKGDIYRGEMDWLLIDVAHIQWRVNNSERQRMVEFADKVRPKIQAEFNPHLSDGVKSVDELEAHRVYLLRTCQYTYYFDAKKYSNALLERGLEILRLSAEFFRSNPQLIPEDIDRQYKIIAGDFGFPIAYGSDESLQPGYFLINAQPYIEAAKKHPLKAANYLGYTLELCRKTVLNNYDKAIFRKNMLEYCRAVDALHISHIPTCYCDSRRSISYQSFLEKNHQDLLESAEEIVAAQLHSVIPMEKLLQDVASEENLDLFTQKVIALVPQLKQLRPQIFTDSKIGCYPGIFANRLYYGIRQNNENCRKALDLLMDGTQITSLALMEKLLIPGSNLEYSEIDRATWYNKMIYLLIWNGSRFGHGKFSVIRFDQESGAVQKINIIPLSNDQDKRHQCCSRNFLVSENYALSIFDESIFLVPLDGSPVTELKDLPGKNIKAATVLDGRVYIFTCKGSELHSQETFLISCLPDGSNRKIHVSTLREDKQNILDRNPSWINTAFADPANKRILFVCENSFETAGLWEFYPESGKFNKLIRGWGLARGNKIGKKVFFTTGSAYYTFDCRDNQIEKQFAIIYRNENEHKNAKTVIPWTATGTPYGFASGPPALFLMQDNRLYLISESRLLMFPPGKPEQSPFIYFPGWKEILSPGPNQFPMASFNPINIFPHLDGSSVIVVGSNNIYKVTLATEKGGSR